MRHAADAGLGLLLWCRKTACDPHDLGGARCVSSVASTISTRQQSEAFPRCASTSHARDPDFCSSTSVSGCLFGGTSDERRSRSCGITRTGALDQLHAVLSTSKAASTHCFCWTSQRIRGSVSSTSSWISRPHRRSHSRGHTLVLRPKPSEGHRIGFAEWET